MTPPSLTPNAIEYGRERLFDIAGAQGLDVPFVYGPADTPLPAPGILILPAPPDAWQQLLHLPPNSLDWLPAEAFFPPGYPRPFDDALPVLFWGEGRQGQQPVWVREDGSVVFQVDILAAALFMLTRWEETILPDRDQHDRFPATASVAYRQGFLDQPIVDRYAMILRAWLQRLQPGWTPRGRAFRWRLSHDIDHLRMFHSLTQFLRFLAADLRRGRWAWLRDDITGMITSRWRFSHNPGIFGIRELARLDESVNAQGYFYILVDARGRFGRQDDITHPDFLALLQELENRGHVVGLHPGYDSYLALDNLLAEKRHLEALLGHSIAHARQHYLRFQVPETWRILERAGIATDATLGYADHEGFRAGTSHPFPPFLWEEDRALTLVEHPLLIMENTLMQYRGLQPDQGLQRMRLLARRVAEVEGEYHLLWHNTSVVREWRPWFAIYRAFLHHPDEHGNADSA